MKEFDEYAVKQVRGPYVKLPKHPDYCETVDELIEYCKARKAAGATLGVDLFAGAGGLSQGLTDAGIEVVLGVDHYDYAVQTHAARFPGVSAAWDLSTSESVSKVADLMKAAEIDVLAGGPPCQPFSKAGRNGIRYLVEQGLRDPIDQRRDLWRAYLEVVQLARPKAVVMENVPDMALDEEMFIMRSMIEELEQIGYSVETRVLEAWRYGVPQFRQRFILVALRDFIKFDWPEELSQKVTVWNAIGDMPEVEGGWRPEGGADGWIEYGEPSTSFQKYMRRNMTGPHENRLYDHITRPVREDDRIAFEMMTSDTKYSELPSELQRYRTDIYNDKYKRLDENDLSRTVTAHISKDGYSYIHPRQARTLTVREAARLQTFPDDFRFSGPPSAAFKQIGNAVPVRLGEALGRAVLESFARGKTNLVRSRDIAKSLADWFSSIPERDLTRPWLREGDRWQILICEIFMERTSISQTRMLWPLIKGLQGCTPSAMAPAESLAILEGVFQGSRYEKRLEKFKIISGEIAENLEAFWAPSIDRAQLPSINAALAAVVELGDGLPGTTKLGNEPVITAKGNLRVASRFHGIDVETRNRQSDGRISVARLLGLSDDSRPAHLALFELSRVVCTSESPRCDRCPLVQWCSYALQTAEKPVETLF